MEYWFAQQAHDLIFPLKFSQLVLILPIKKIIVLSIGFCPRNLGIVKRPGIPVMLVPDSGKFTNITGGQ